MAASACHITTDLTKVAFYDDTGATQWAPPETEDDSSFASAAYRQRAQAAAQWLSQQGGTKRLSIVCVDTREALCTWIQARSASHQIVASAYRDQTQGWGEDAASVAVEPILSEAHEYQQSARHAQRWSFSRTKKSTAEAHETATAPTDSRVSTAVITFHDALIRLWLDALDQRGIRPGAVISLWHALALAWAENDGGPSAVLYITDENDLAWSWTRGGDLLAGGTVAAPAHQTIHEGEHEKPEPPDPDLAAEHRLSLDWLSWGAHLGVFPESVTIISHRETALGGALGERFRELRIENRTLQDPLRETLKRAGAALAAPTSEMNPRRCLLRLTNRPTRSVRRRYHLVAAALVLAAVALLGLGVRFQRGASSMQPVIALYEDEQSDLIARVGRSEVTESRRPISALRSLINEQQNIPEPTPPPAPPPVYEEIRIITDVISNFETVDLATLTLGETGSSRNSQIRVDAEDRRVQINFESALKESGTNVEWSRQQRGTSSRSLTLSGTWKTGGE